jgi:thiamine biosynthesis protein ThiI
VSLALVVHYHEVGLKGRNRQFFEEKLARNLKRALRGTGYSRLRRGFGRIVVDLDEDANVEAAFERASRVFGIANVGLGPRLSPDIDEIERAAVELMTSEPIGSFAVRARRTYSTLDVKSNEINNRVGQAIVDATGAPVNLKQPDTTLHIELFGSACFVFRRRSEGPGGLPVGTSGRMLSLLSGGIDSPVASWRMARRGAELEFIHFHGQPYTDPSSVRQVAELLEVLTRYQLRSVLHLIPLGNIQREIVMNSPASMRVILYRRTMMRIAAALAKQIGATALVTGDSLGQVASQTIENMTTVDRALAHEDVPVLRPLVGADKQEIMAEARRIGTYEISTRQYQDCCVLFEPRSPATRTNPDLAQRAEDGLDIDAFVGKALAEVETRTFELPPP